MSVPPVDNLLRVMMVFFLGSGTIVEDFRQGGQTEIQGLVENVGKDPSQLGCTVLQHLSGDAVGAHRFPWVHCTQYAPHLVLLHSEGVAAVGWWMW